MNFSDSFYKNVEKLEIPSYPFYGYDNSEEIDKDVDYIKSLYPINVRQIQKEVEEECDKLEYDGSCMFDVCPDRVHLNTIVDAIYERINDADAKATEVQAENLLGPGPVRPPWDSCGPGGNCPPPPPPRPWPPCGPNGNCPPPPPPRPVPPPPRPDFRPDGEPNWIRNLIQSLLFNEMLHRRRRYRSRKRY